MYSGETYNYRLLRDKLYGRNRPYSDRIYRPTHMDFLISFIYQFGRLLKYNFVHVSVREHNRFMSWIMY